MEELIQGTNVYFLVFFGVALAILWARRVPLREWGPYFVSIGILGTFTGILVALLGFDTSAIDQSVPRLIEGMRTAFFTSVLGMGLSVFFRVLSVVIPSKQADAGEPTAQDYHRLMQDQHVTLLEIKAAVGGDGDSSMLTQLQKLRLDMQEFMKKLEEQSTKAIIAALEQVVADFNKNLSEQFGENFKQLNEAVGRMVTWMDNHETLITQSEQRLQTAISGIEAAKDGQRVAAQALLEIVQHATTIRQQAEQTVSTVGTLTTQIEGVRDEIARLGGDAGTLASSVETLAAALPQLESTTNSLSVALHVLEEVAAESGGTTKAVQAMTQAVQENATAVASQHRELLSAIEAQVETLSENLTEAQGELFGALSKSLQTEVTRLRLSLSRAQNDAFDQIRDDLEKAGTKNKEAIDEQIAALDQALGVELEKALKVLAGKLASLSQKFADDYTPLTNELQRVVTLSREIELERNRTRRG